MKKIVSSNNFVGFLCAVHSFFANKNAETIVSESQDKSFLDEYIYAGENEETAQRVRRGFKAKGGTLFYDELCDAYLSCHPLKEEIILGYLKLFAKCGKSAFSMFDRPEVIAFKDILNKVRHEAARLSGFIRLMETESGIYYGYFSSDNDVLEKVIRMLVPRFNSQSFVLHDYKRQKIGVWDGKSLSFAKIEGGVDITLSERERVFQSLWRQYHSNVSIKERENLGLQQRFLPKKYRHFMHEF